MKKKTLTKALAVMAVVVCNYSYGQTWTTLDYPFAHNPLNELGTFAHSVSGNVVVGYKGDGGSFTYNISNNNYGNILSSYVYNTDGTNLVGGNGGPFVINIASGNKTLLPDSEGFSKANAIQGSVVVGIGVDPSGGLYGAIYNLSNGSLQKIHAPNAVYTEFFDISGDNILGYSSESGNFIYNAGQYTFLNLPNSSARAFGLDGSNVVGSFIDETSGGHTGFLYSLDTSAWITFVAPNSINTYVRGVDGNNIVGYYGSSTGYHGFIVNSVPEPSSLSLLALGGVLVALRRRR